FVITAIIAATLLSILYLSRIARDLQEYTFAGNNSTEILLYSSSDLRFNDGEINKILDYIVDSTIGFGVKVKNLGVIDDNENIEKILKKQTNGGKTYIVLDISASNKIINKDTILIRIEKNENYNNNIGFANSIKSKLSKERINILGETKCYNQEFGDKALKIEISNKLTIDEAKKLIDKLLYGIYQSL
ncbi:MAG: hypothetical protein N2594_03270, partial [Clostridiales bacterium]|nr:hypothetical protein [Clostridiales bacterium]